MITHKNHVRHLLSSANISTFHQRLAIFVTVETKDKNCNSIHNLILLNLTEFLNVVLTT